MSNDALTEREYIDGVQELAESIAEESVSQCDTREDVEEWLSETVWESVDGHEWVIYTHYHYDVLRHSPNDAYSVENFGVETIIKDGELNTAALAFGALYADVQERITAAVESAWDEHESKKEKAS